MADPFANIQFTEDDDEDGASTDPFAGIAFVDDADEVVDPKLQEMDENLGKIKVDKEQVNYEPTDFGAGGEQYETKAAYTDAEGVPFDSSGNRLDKNVLSGETNNTTITEEKFPSEIVRGIQDKEGQVTSRAYEGLSYGDALKVYETIANHPEAETDRTGSVVYLNGSRVPVPEPEMFGDGAKVGSVQLGGDGILQFASNVVDLISAGTNKIAAATGGEENIPYIDYQGIKAEGVVDNIQKEGPALLTGGSAGLRTANAVVGGNVARLAGPMGEIQIADGILSKLGIKMGSVADTLTKSAVRGAGVNTATVAGMDDDTSGVFVGDEALLPSKYVEILSTDGRTQGGEILAKKLNLLSDAFVTGGVASGIGMVGTGAKKILYDGILSPMATGLFTSPQQKRIIEEIVTATGNLPVNATAQDQKNFALRMKNVIEANKDVFAQTPTSGIDVELDPLAAFASALENSGNKADQLDAIRARTVRNDVFSSRLAEPEAKQNTYGEAVDKLQSDLYEAGGEEAGVEAARSGIIQAGRDEAAVSRGAADLALSNVEKNTKNIEQVFRMNSTVGQKLAALEKDGVDINTFRRANESTEEVVKRIEAGEKTFRGARDKAYDDLTDAIPDGAQFNDPTFDDVFTDAKNYIKPSVVKLVEDNADNNYKMLRTKVLPAVNSAIKQTEPGSAPYQALLDLKENIEVTQFDSLDPATKALVQSAKDAVTEANENYYNWFSKGTLKDVGNSQRSVGTFKESGNINRSEQLTASGNSANVVDSLFDNSNRDSLQLVGEFLQTPEGGRSAKPLVDIGIAKMVQASRKAAQTGGVGAIDSQQLISSLGNFASTLETIAPKQYKTLQDMIGFIRKNENNGVELERIANEAEQLAKTTETNILDKELGAFFKGSGPSRVELSEGQEVFNGLFSNKKNVTNEVNTIVKRAKESGPEAVNGVKAAFAKSFKFTAQSTDAEKSDFSRVIQTAKQVYEDEPTVVEALETGFKLIKDTKVTGENRIGLKNLGSEVTSGGILGANRLITMIWGVLNPTATKIRTLTSIAARNADPSSKMVKILGEAVSDTTTFTAMLDDFISSGVVNDSRRLFDFMVKAGVYSNTNEEYQSFNERLQQEQMNTEKDTQEEELPTR